jgi:hypothetical protein
MEVAEDLVKQQALVLMVLSLWVPVLGCSASIFLDKFVS